MIDITFNTGRCYTAEGQVIRATYDPATLELRFDDHSRMISGSYANVRLSTPNTLERLEEEPERFARFVMRFYDRGEYQWAPSRGRTVDTPLAYRI